MTDDRDIVVRLTERAHLARHEGNATASIDADCFQRAADEIERLRTQAEQLRRHKAETMALLDKTLDAWKSGNDSMRTVIDG